MNKPRNPILSFLWKKPAVLVALVVLFFLFKSEAAFQSAGPLLYLPVMMALVLFVAFAARNLAWRSSLDEYANRGMFTQHWKQLTPAEQVRWTIVVTLVLILCTSIVAAGLAR